MKPILLIIILLFIGLITNGQTSNPSWLTDTLRSYLAKIDDSVFCSEKEMVMPRTFNKLTSNVLTKVAPNIAGDIKHGTGANIKFSDDKTSAEIQSTFRLSTKLLLNFGFNGAITNNVSEIYSGKTGLGTDWGTKLGLSRTLFRGLIYSSKNYECQEFHLQRTQYLISLYNALRNHLDTNRTLLENSIKAAIVNVDIQKSAGNFSDYSITANASTMNSLAINIVELKLRKAMFGKDSTDLDLQKSLYDYIEDSVVAYEERSSKWIGYNVLLLNIGSFFNNKGFTQFNPSTPSYKKRFYDTSYSNYGISIGASLFHAGLKTQQNFNLDLVYRNQSNFELPENKKFNKTYTTDSAISTSNPTVQQFSTSSKKAFDSTYVSFKTFTSFNVNFQYTILLGENKVFGLNVAGNYSNSKFYSVPNRFDILFGPVISLPNTDKDASKLNFGLMAGFKNIFDNLITTKDKFTISFNVNIPFKIIAFK